MHNFLTGHFGKSIETISLDVWVNNFQFSIFFSVCWFVEALNIKSLVLAFLSSSHWHYIFASVFFPTTIKVYLRFYCVSRLFSYSNFAQQCTAKSFFFRKTEVFSSVNSILTICSVQMLKMHRFGWRKFADFSGSFMSKRTELFRLMSTWKFESVCELSF